MNKYKNKDKGHAGPVRIAMLGHKRIPSREGGIEVVVEQLAGRLAAEGYIVTCINRGGHSVAGKDYDGPDLKEYNSVSLRTAFTLDLPGIAAVTASFTGSLMAAFGPYDIVHYHAEGPCLFIWIPVLFGKKCVVTVHGLDWQRAKWSRYASSMIRLGEKMAARHAEKIIVLSRSVSDYFMKNYGRRTVCIPNGVSRPEREKADLISLRYDLTKDSYLLFAGRLVPEKGLEYLIKAFKGVNTDKKLVIAGGESDAADFADRMRRLAADDDRIIFTGFMEGHELGELFSNPYIYLIPSDLEGMPLSLLEAMSYGNCCVTSDIAECTDVTGKWAYSFERGNVKKLRRLIQDLIDHPEKVERMREGAADYICGRYSWERTVKETMEVYGQLRI